MYSTVMNLTRVIKDVIQNVWKYRKIPNISPGLINIRKHLFWGLYSWGAYIRGACIRGGLIFGALVFGRHFVLVSQYQHFKIHCYISLL